MRQHRLQPASARPNESSFFATLRSYTFHSGFLFLHQLPTSNSPTTNSNFENRFVRSLCTYRTCVRFKKEEKKKEKTIRLVGEWIRKKGYRKETIPDVGRKSLPLIIAISMLILGLA